MSSSSSSTATQQQFRYTQTPSKVLHLRNLPWECAPEELAELCKPFGPIVDTKCNVGANRNQAFVEFAELNQAISMVSYYATSSEPAQIRGKTVYIQYSNRQEIVHSKTVGESVGNVLLVTIEGVEAGDVSIDVLHLVFSAFGFVQKLATFEKTMGFQALVQYPDTDTATAARDALDGRSIPRYLLPEHVNTCYLRISYSAHTDLNIKFQSHRSRDYTNPYLPVNPTAIEGTAQQVTGPDGKKIELESNVLHANFENAQYPITVDVLHTVFSAFGVLQKIAIFEKNGGTQALIQYPDIATAKVAKGALEGHSIYDGGYCKIHLTYSRHTDLVVKAYSDKSRDYTVPIGGIGAMPRPPVPMPAAPNSWQNTGPVPPMYNGQMPPYPAGAMPFSGQAFPQHGQHGPPFQASQPGPPFPASANSQPGPPSPASGNHLQGSQPMLFNGVQARPPHYYQ